MTGSDAATPELTSEFLADVWAALAGRRKAIRYHVRGLTIEAASDGEGAEDGRKIEVYCPISRAPNTTLGLHLWHDRWCWIDARSRGKRSGWAWEFRREGRPLASAVEIVAALEASIAAASPVEPNPAERLDIIWRSILATGPRELPTRRIARL